MKKIVIIGGGKVGTNLIKLLLRENSGVFDITLIETRSDRCQDIANQYGIRVIHGDGSQLTALRSAGCDECEAFIALTGNDEDNLVACQMAKREFNVRAPITRINDPRNLATVHRLGIHNTFSSTLLLAERLNQEITYSGLYVAYNIPGNTKAIVEFRLSSLSDAVGKSLIEYRFPGQSRVVLVTRASGEVILPIGSTVLQAGDRLMLVCDQEDFAEIHERMVAKTSDHLQMLEGSESENNHV